MNNFIINLIKSIFTHYFCKMLDKFFFLFKQFIKEKWYTYFMIYEYLFFILYISLIAFGIGFVILIPIVYL